MENLNKGTMIKLNRLCSSAHRYWSIKRSEKKVMEGKTGIVERIDEDGKIWCDFGFGLHAIDLDDDFETVENNPVIAIKYIPAQGWHYVLKDHYVHALDVLHHHLGSPVERISADNDLGKHGIVMWILDNGKLLHKEPSFVMMDKLGNLADIIVGTAVFMKFDKDGSPTAWSWQDIEFLRTHFLNTGVLNYEGKHYPVKIMMVGDNC